jgi:hypothetical protein
MEISVVETLLVCAFVGVAVVTIAVAGRASRG